MSTCVKISYKPPLWMPKNQQVAEKSRVGETVAGKRLFHNEVFGRLKQRPGF